MAGHLEAPTVMQMGEIIHKINSGGVKGLVSMGFLDPGQKRDMGAVCQAFSQYYDWSLLTFSEEERTRWSWSVVTAENHLCKHSRLKKLISAL